MSQSKQSLVTVFSLVARAVLMVVGFTLPVLSLYGEGDAQTAVETSEIAEVGNAAAVDELTGFIESLESN